MKHIVENKTVTTVIEKEFIVHAEDIYKMLGLKMPDIDITNCSLRMGNNHSTIDVGNIFDESVVNTIIFTLKERTIESGVL